MKDEEAVFAEVVAVDSLAERAAALDRACAGDGGLRRRVEALLDAHDKARGILDVTPAGFGGGDGPPATAAVGSHVGPYKLLELIGEGGMGAVYMAEQHRPVRRMVALKIIKPGMDTKQAIARFEAERQALAMMDHLNIARVLDAGSTDAGRLYFVMELVKGMPITEYCDQNKLTPRQRLVLFVKVCHAVQHAHQKGIIHRDLKPTNVLVTLHDGTPVPKIIDFGIAKATAGRLTDLTLFTNFAQMVGTPLYMSPEQAELSGLDVDTRSDVYSLGVLLYELLTGTTPFDRQRLGKAAYDEIRRIIREEEPPKPSTRISTLGVTLTAVSSNRAMEPKKLGQLVRGELDWIVMKALEKDRTRRYETADAFAEDVTRHLDDMPVAACPPSRAYLVKKFARRNRSLALPAAAVVVVLAGATVVSSWLAVRAHSAEKRAESETQKAKTEAAVASAVNQFMGDLFQRAVPRKEEDRDLKVRTLLDRASDQIEAGVNSNPVVETRVREMLARAYLSLKEYEKAEKHILRAIELWRVQLGEDDKTRLNLLINLGHLYQEQGRHGDADRVLASTSEAYRRRYGERYEDTLRCMYALAWNRMDMGRDADAEELFRRVERLSRDAFGDEHEQTLMARTGVAVICNARRKREEAERLFKQVLDARRRLNGQDDPSTMDVLLWLALVYREGQQPQKAEATLRQLLPVQRRTIGAEDPRTLRTMVNLGGVLDEQGRHAEAEQLVRDVVDSNERIHGADSRDATGARMHLAHHFFKSKQFENARDVYEDVIDRSRRTHRDDDPAVATALTRLRHVEWMLFRQRLGID